MKMWQSHTRQFRRPQKNYSVPILVKIVSDPHRASFNFNSDKATVANYRTKKTMNSPLGIRTSVTIKDLISEISRILINLLVITLGWMELWLRARCIPMLLGTMEVGKRGNSTHHASFNTFSHNLYESHLILAMSCCGINYWPGRSLFRRQLLMLVGRISKFQKFSKWRLFSLDFFYIFDSLNGSV
jgi:hypothetical protein